MRREQLGFVVRFALLLGALSALVAWEPFGTHVRDPYTVLLAASTGHVLDLVGVAAYGGGNIVVPYAGGHQVAVTSECDGIVLICLILAATFASPVRWHLRSLVGVLGAVLVLVALNWVRVAVLTIVIAYYPAAFEAMHYYVMQGVLILATLAVFLYWADRAYAHPRTELTRERLAQSG